MTRKDYIAVARVLSDAQFVNCVSNAEVRINTDTRRKIAFQLCNVFAADNQAFDRARFLQACGVQS